MNFQQPNIKSNLFKKLNIGYNNFFGFTFKLLDINNNNGNNNLFISAEFGNKILINTYPNSRYFQLKNNFSGTYSNNYKCNFRFKLIKDKQLYLTIGHAGTHGFNGGQYTKRETLGKRFRKKLYNQLYNHLKTLKK